MTPAFALKRKPDAAFEALYRRHVHEVYRYTLVLLGNPSDAEDVTQTTFLNAYRAIQAGERPRKPGHWLRAIAHNVCKQRFRQAARRPREVVALDGLRGPELHDEPDVPTAIDIKRAIQSLPFNQRSAIVMRELEGRRQSEIAETLGLSESAVEALLFRARRAMREQLEASITCGEAERAVSRQLDGELPRAERGRLRAHLRECEECAGFARQTRAQRGALKSLAAVPLPASLLSWGGGSSVAGAGVAVGLKVTAGLAAVAVAVGAGDLGIRYLESGPVGRAPATEHREASRARAGDVAARTAFPAQASAGRTSRERGSSAVASSADVRGRSRPHGRGAKRSPMHAHGTPKGLRGHGTHVHGSPARGRGSAGGGSDKQSRAHRTPARAHRTPAGGHSGRGHHGRPPRAPAGHTHGQAAPHAQHPPPGKHRNPPARAHGKPNPDA